MKWVYVAQSADATADSVEMLANEHNFICRNPYNAKNRVAANIRRVSPNDIMLLYCTQEASDGKQALTMRLMGIYKVLPGNTTHFRAVPDNQLKAVYFFCGKLDLSELGYSAGHDLEERFHQTHAGFVVRKLDIADIPEELAALPVPRGQNQIFDLEGIAEEYTIRDLQRAVDLCT